MKSNQAITFTSRSVQDPSRRQKMAAWVLAACVGGATVLSLGLSPALARPSTRGFVAPPQPAVRGRTFPAAANRVALHALSGSRVFAKSRYSAFKKVSGGFSTVDKVGGLVATFTSKGVKIKSSRPHTSWSLGVVPVSYGRNTRASVVRVKPKLAGQRLRYAYKGFTEWFVNGPGGIEQGLTIAKPPGGPASTPVSVNFKLTGGLKALDSPSGRVIRFQRSHRTLLTYGGLWSTDSRHLALPAQASVVGSTLRLVVNDAGASYPITVDPYFFAQELTASDIAAEDRFGCAVALSADGSVALIGACYLTGASAAYIFERSGSTYVQTQELTASDGLPSDQFGLSVALSADGSEALIGAPGGGTSATGKAYVFRRGASGYVQVDEMFGAASSQGDEFGGSVALSDSGSVALVSAVLYNNRSGTAYLYNLGASSHTLIEELQPPDAGHDQGYFGSDVALSGDGQVAVVLAGLDTTIQPPSGDAYVSAGTVFVYKRSGATYIPFTELVDMGYLGSVATSEDGTTILVGSPDRTIPGTEFQVYAGAAFLFTEQGSGYVQSQELTSSDGVDGDQFGGSVALSRDGSVALVAAYYHPGLVCTGPAFSSCAGTFGPGAVYIFTREGASYTQTNGFAAYDGADVSQFGNSDALSSDGSVALIGSATHNTGAGSAYVYGPTGEPATTSVALTGGNNPSNYGDGSALTFTATLGPASEPPQSGTVDFWDGPPSDTGSVELGGAPVSDGRTVFTTSAALPAGQRYVYAVYDGSPSYAGSQNSVEQTVNPVPLSIVADDQTVAIGTKMPAFTFTGGGFVNGDSSASFTIQPTCSSTATVDGSGNDTSPAGTYPITCAGALDPNYTIGYVAGR
jgi:trimeric autotransporter adhesin